MGNNCEGIFEFIVVVLPFFGQCDQFFYIVVSFCATFRSHSIKGPLFDQLVYSKGALAVYIERKITLPQNLVKKFVFYTCPSVLYNTASL